MTTNDHLQHNPGPWLFAEDPVGKFGIYPKGGFFIAITDTKDNARLIAAAPEMLVALQAIVALVQSVAASKEAVMELAIPAISKATT